MELLQPKPTEVYHFDFHGFGAAKTRLLEAPDRGSPRLKNKSQESYKRFPALDYVLLVEPDMYPANRFHRNVLEKRQTVYAIRRSGKESRGRAMFGPLDIRKCD